MKTAEQERLLADVLHDESYIAFRRELGEAMLKSARARRRRRWTKPLLALAACVAITLTANSLLQTRAPVVVPASTVVTIRSVPLRPEQIVTTASAMRNLAVVHSRTPESLPVVSTVTLPVKGLSDEELLALFQGRAVALVGAGADRRLMFLDEDQTPGGGISHRSAWKFGFDRRSGKWSDPQHDHHSRYQYESSPCVVVGFGFDETFSRRNR